MCHLCSSTEASLNLLGSFNIRVARFGCSIFFLSRGKENCRIVFHVLKCIQLFFNLNLGGDACGNIKLPYSMVFFICRKNAVVIWESIEFVWQSTFVAPFDCKTHECSFNLMWMWGYASHLKQHLTIVDMKRFEILWDASFYDLISLYEAP